MCRVDLYDEWMVSRVPGVRQHLQVMPAEKKCRRCRCQNEHESIEGSVHVGGAAEWRAAIAGRSMATGHTVVAVEVGRWV